MGEQLAYLVKCLQVGGRIAAGALADGPLVDKFHCLQAAHVAIDAAVASRSVGGLVELARKPLAGIIRDEGEIGRYTQLMMAVILGYAQMAQKTFVVESLADNRETYVKSSEEFIDGMAGASR